MKKSLIFVLLVLLLSVFLYACDDASSIKNYYLDEEGNLIAENNDGSTVDLGLFNDVIENGVEKVLIDKDGYYVINGVTTTIKVKTPQSYNINTQGKLIVTYSDNTTEDLGTLSDTIANGVDRIDINRNGYYVINNISTTIKAKLPQSYAINVDGYLIVTYTDTTTENLGKFGNDAINTIDTISISDDGFYILNGIKTAIVAIDVYDVTFNTGYSATVNKQMVKDGYKVVLPELERIGYTLDGWYCNDERWLFNSDVVLNDMTLTARWTANSYEIQFENEKGANPNGMLVEYDSDVDLPEVEEVTGCTFIGWYYDNNTLVDGDDWSIASDVTLTAKWAVNTYTVTLDPGVGSVPVASISVTYGEEYALPVPSNNYGAFIGWLYNDSPVTDTEGHSLANWTYTSNLTFNTDWTIKVYSVDDLKKMSTYLNGEFILMNDLDMQDIDWIPVGTQNKPFVGKLDGDNHTINNLSFSSFKTSIGLFGWLSGTVENLNIENVQINITSITNESYIGALCGCAKNATINSISVTGDISSSAHSSDYTVLTAGICAGAENSNLNNIINNANVSGYDMTGGILASSYKTIISNVQNNGIIVSSQSYAGGIIAHLVETNHNQTIAFNHLCNKGNITGYSGGGGIIGGSSVNTMTESIIDYCCNYGNITVNATSGDAAAGGIVGGNSYFTFRLTECYNRGNINGLHSGGLVGKAAGATFIRCYSSGTITTSFYGGGLGAFVPSATIKDCIVFGSISGSSLIGNACGAGTNLDVTNLYYNCICSKNEGTHTDCTYEKDFYINTLFWTEYNPMTNQGYWVFSNTEYPKLYWE